MHDKSIYRYLPILALLAAALLLAACSGELPLPGEQSTQAVSEVTPIPLLTDTPAPTATLPPTETPTEAPTATPAATATPEPTVTPAPTNTPAATNTLHPTETPATTPTPTEAALPQATIRMQANCRYGPAQAYLYSHGMYTGDRVEVHGRNAAGNWLWIKPEDLERRCWAAASVMEINSGDPRTAPVVQTRLPQSVLYGPPQNVRAERSGDQVTVSWDKVWMTEDDDRGYLIEAIVCQNGSQISTIVRTDETFYVFSDDQTCSGESSAQLYTVEKHGYTDSVPVPWP